MELSNYGDVKALKSREVLSLDVVFYHKPKGDEKKNHVEDKNQKDEQLSSLIDIRVYYFSRRKDVGQFLEPIGDTVFINRCNQLELPPDQDSKHLNIGSDE
jgi:hypothetical protein